MSNREDIVLMAVLPVMFIFWAYVVWAILEWRKMRHKSLLQSKIVDKFQNVQEFDDFLQSPGGNKFLSFLKFNGPAPREKILSTLSRGIIIMVLGISLIIIGKIFPGGVRYLLAFGIVLIALGMGFLISTLTSYLLCKKWGIIEEKE